MATTTIEKTKASASDAPREAPRIKQNALEWNSRGFAYGSAFVRLPEGMTLQDLNDTPTVWQNVQTNAGTSLRKWDTVRAVAFDESWFIDATVNFADGSQVVLCGIKKTDAPTRAISLYEDAIYKVEWAGSGYGVIRKSDGVLMGQQTSTMPEGARAYLLSLYPKQRSVGIF